MDKFEAMRIFIEVAECKSFVAASRELEMSAPAVTRAIAQLEHSMGLRLFNRTTRHVRLTDSGARFYEDAKRILDDVEQTIATVSGSYTHPKGTLSVTAPILFGQIHIAPIMTEYLQLNPYVSVNAIFCDRVTNILEEGLDVAIRIGHLKDSSEYAIQLGSVRKVVCASPAYLEKYGMPMTPSDLKEHEIIQASTVEPSTSWKFEGTDSKTTVKVSPRLHCTSNGAAITAASQGFGVTRLMSYQVGEEIKKGALIRILQEYEPQSLPVSIVYLEGRRANAKIRSFVELAVTRLRDNPYIHH